ncbi:hypothetical protein WJX82_002911 [Trebouxia sp. C0006]
MPRTCTILSRTSTFGLLCRRTCSPRGYATQAPRPLASLLLTRRDCLSALQAAVRFRNPTKPAQHQAVSTMAHHSQEALGKFSYEVVPQLSSELSKGMSGKVATIGGCREYTGAPYFASITCLRVGADLSHCFCTSGAATVIKSYSPELIVHPYLPDSTDYDDDLAEDKKQKIFDKSLGAIKHWLERFDTIIIGPGLGRDEMVHHVVIEAIKWMRENNKHMVLDADGLYIVTKNLDLIKGYKNAILTPNKAEFGRLAKQLDVDLEDKDRQDQLEQIAKKLEGPLVVQKGAKDGISDGTTTIYCEGGGSKRRAGGQGDVMTGAIATHLAWILTYQERANDPSKFPGGLPPLMLAAWGGCHIARVAAELSFAIHKRSMVAGDVIDKLGEAVDKLYGSKT